MNYGQHEDKIIRICFTCTALFHSTVSYKSKVVNWAPLSLWLIPNTVALHKDYGDVLNKMPTWRARCSHGAHLP